MKSPKILIVDVLSATHVGNAALLDSTLEQLKTEFYGAEFTILAFDPISIGELCGHRSVKTLWAEPFSTISGNRILKLFKALREVIWALINIINFSVLRRMKVAINPKIYTHSIDKLAAVKYYVEADIVISISGEALQDALIGRLPFFLYGYWLAHAMGKMVAIFPQSIGPLNRKLSRIMVGFVLNRCDLVFPRDHISLDTVNKLGINTYKIHLVPDVAINQPYISSESAKRLLDAEGVRFDQQPLIGMSVSKWKGDDFNNYFPVMKELGQFVIDELGGELVLFSPNMPFQEELSDFEISEMLYQSLSHKAQVTLLKHCYTPREFKGMQGELDLFVTTRMHSAILSTMICTPTICIVTQPKLFGYMQMIHQEDRAIEVKDFTLEKAKEMVRETLLGSNQIRQCLFKTRQNVGEQSLMASHILRQAYYQRLIKR